MFGRILGAETVVLVVSVAFGLASAVAADGDSKEFQAIAALQRKYGDALMALPGVNGHGIGMKDTKLALHIYAETETGKTNADNFVKQANKKNGDKELSDTLEDHPVVIEVIGKIRPH